MLTAAMAAPYSRIHSRENFMGLSTVRIRICILAALALSACLSTAAAVAQVSEHSARSTMAVVSVATLSVPGKAWKHFEKARTAARAARRAECLQEIDKALEIAPQFAEAYLLRADRAVVDRQFEAAIEDVLTAQRLEPTIAWSQVVLASAYNGLERFNDASLLLSNLQGKEADSWQAKYEMARAQVGRRDVEAALHWSEIALAAAPLDFADAHILRANALQIAHRWQEATAEMEAYLASRGPQTHRAEVLAAIEHTRLLARK